MGITPSLLRTRPLSQTLTVPYALPLTPLDDLIGYWAGSLGYDKHFHPSFIYEVRKAILHHFFVDAEAKQWEAYIASLHDDFVSSAQDDMRIELLNTISRLMIQTIGPLMPSLEYRYEVVDDALIITPSIPSIEHLTEKIHDLANPEDGWVPDRFRR